MRDDFSTATKDLLARRVSYRCSNPDCRQPTSGPQEDPNRAINVGVAAHISAASPGGARYDPGLTSEQRRSLENGLWLCQTCGKLIDSDESRYSAATLAGWKRIAELAALKALERRSDPEAEPDAAFLKAERLMPELIREMREDLAETPLRRECVFLQRAWTYWAKGNELFYFYDDHPELDTQVQVLENLGLVRDITYNNTKRFLLNEPFADWLSQRGVV